MRNHFSWWCFLLLVTVGLFAFIVARHGKTVAFLSPVGVVLLLVLALALALGTFYRSPLNRARNLPEAVVEPFLSVRLDGKLNGNAIALRFLTFLEAGAASPSYFSSQDSVVEVTFGPGKLSISQSALMRAWDWLRAREIVTVGGIFDDGPRPMQILVQFKKSTIRVEAGDDTLGLDRALLSAARLLLENLDPVSLARSYWYEQNYLEAIRLFKVGIRNSKKPDPQFELDLANVELQCERADSALARLQRLEKAKLPEKVTDGVMCSVAEAYFRRGQYKECIEKANEGLKRRHMGENAARLHSLLGSVEACGERYAPAATKEATAYNAALEELHQRVNSPLKTWSQIWDEVSVVPNKNEHLQILWLLCVTSFSQGVCESRLPDNDPTDSFTRCMSAVSALSWVDLTTGRPREFRAEVYRAHAAFWQRQNKTAEMNVALGNALLDQEDAIQRYTSEGQFRPGDLGISVRLAWSYFGKFDCLYRMSQTAAAGAGSKLEADKALSECKERVKPLEQLVYKWYVAEAAYVSACISAVQSNVEGAVGHLRRAIEMTMSADVKFSNIVNRAREYWGFDCIRQEPSFRKLIYESYHPSWPVGVDP